MPRFPKWAIGLAAVALIGFLTWAFWPSKHRDVVTPPQVDSLTAVNAALKLKLATTQGQIIADSVEKAAVVRERDSIKAASAKGTQRIKAAAAKLPVPAVVPDTELRAAYATAVTTLDSAIQELGRKDLIITKDSIVAAQDDWIKYGLTVKLATADSLYGNEQRISESWYNQYRNAVKQQNKPRCGRKCGILLGVGLTVGGAIAIKHVQDVLEPHGKSPDRRPIFQVALH